MYACTVMGSSQNFCGNNAHIHICFNILHCDYTLQSSVSDRRTIPLSHLHNSFVIDKRNISPGSVCIIIQPISVVPSGIHEFSLLSPNL